MALTVTVAEFTELFVGPVYAPRQLVRVGITGPGLITVGLTMAPAGTTASAFVVVDAGPGLADG